VRIGASIANATGPACARVYVGVVRHHAAAGLCHPAFEARGPNNPGRALIDTGAARGVACAADTADAAAAGSPGQAAQPFRPARRAAPELKRYRARRSLWHKLSNTPVSAELRVDT
jgi:hypothetical protein